MANVLYVLILAIVLSVLLLLCIVLSVLLILAIVLSVLLLAIALSVLLPKNRSWHIMLEMHGFAWDRHTYLARLNRLMEFQPYLYWQCHLQQQYRYKQILKYPVLICIHSKRPHSITNWILLSNQMFVAISLLHSFTTCKRIVLLQTTGGKDCMRKS